MLGAVAGLASREGVDVTGFEAAAVSYPGSADDLRELAGAEPGPRKRRLLGRELFRGDAELDREVSRAAALCDRFNSTPSTDEGALSAILAELLGRRRGDGQTAVSLRLRLPDGDRRPDFTTGTARCSTAAGSRSAVTARSPRGCS